MNATSSGVAFSAAKIRSPSFSRFSSSMTMTALPAAMSATARSTLSNLVIGRLLLHGGAAPRRRCSPASLITAAHQLFDVLRDDVHLKIDLPSGRHARQRRLSERRRDQRHLKPGLT